MIPPLFQHQQDDLERLKTMPIAMNLSDCGTGKTRTAIELIRHRRPEGRTLIVCPKSIMEVAWGNDIQRFAPDLVYTIADHTHRAEAFASQAPVVIINHDGVLWVKKTLQHTQILKNFAFLIIDESTAFKNDSQRSRAMYDVAQHFKYRLIMTGTLYTNSILDVWRQTLLCDNGQRLGNSFYRFRSQTCQSVAYGNGVKTWTDKPDIQPVIQHLIQDITIRHTLEECTNIPTHSIQNIEVDLSPKHYKLYKTLENEAFLQLTNQQITAVNAAVLLNKLLQLIAGAVYTTDGSYSIINPDRYELIRDLALAYPQCVIVFNWKHQRDELKKLLPEAEVLDGDIPQRQREDSINQFQKGLVPQLLIHPKTAAHGITLTQGVATLWASPTYSSEAYKQTNHRIYRAGQTRKTTTVHVIAKNTIEAKTYEALQKKMNNLLSLNDLLTHDSLTHD